jgi:hypothetical protein
VSGWRFTTAHSVYDTNADMTRIRLVASDHGPTFRQDAHGLALDGAPVPVEAALVRDPWRRDRWCLSMTWPDGTLTVSSVVSTVERINP